MRSLRRQDLGQCGWRACGLSRDDPAEVALVGEAQLGGQTRQVALARGQALERAASTQTHAMTRDAMAGLGAKDATEVMGRDRQRIR